MGFFKNPTYNFWEKYMLKRKKGFSIIELMIGIFILSSLIVLVAGLYTRLFKMSSKGVDLTAGTAVGEKVLEEFVQEKITVPLQNLTYDDSITGKFFYGSKSVNGSTFSYAIEVQNAGSQATLKIVDITVKWWDNSAEPLDSNQTGDANLKATAFFDSEGKARPLTGTETLPVTEYGLSSVGATALPANTEMRRNVSNYGAAYTKLTKLVFVPI